VSAAFFRALARDAASRYPAGDRYARHFAYGKLTRDPAFRRLLELGLLERAASVLDLGCGQGLLAVLLIEARSRHAAGAWPTAWPAPAPAGELRGVDFRARDVERARAACGRAATFEAGDIRTAEFGRAQAIVILDVLHYVDPAAQQDVLERVREALAPKGMLLLRVGDDSPGLRFRITHAVDRISMALRGHRIGRFHTRPARAWRAQLAALGFEVESHAMSEGTPFANVLLVARYHSR
jgi:SAM-dependent methyltransferase